ncbi:MAG: hypothetical protein KY396_04610 [Actinobacteria bacterium]|nr:hypothetical protein [Actinomycetota bacterium]
MRTVTGVRKPILGPSELRALGIDVRAFPCDRERVLAGLREVERSVPAGADGFPLVVLEYGIELHERMASWCVETERRLARGGDAGARSSGPGAA